MQMKLKVTVAAAIAAAAGVALAQDMGGKIGHVAPISGAQASYGKDNENGARMAIEDLNAAGVMIGGKKVKLELVAEDDVLIMRQARGRFIQQEHHGLRRHIGGDLHNSSAPHIDDSQWRVCRRAPEVGQDLIDLRRG